MAEVAANMVAVVMAEVESTAAAATAAASMEVNTVVAKEVNMAEKAMVADMEVMVATGASMEATAAITVATAANMVDITDTGVMDMADTVGTEATVGMADMVGMALTDGMAVMAVMEDGTVGGSKTGGERAHIGEITGTITTLTISILLTFIIAIIRLHTTRTPIAITTTTMHRSTTITIRK